MYRQLVPAAIAACLIAAVPAPAQERGEFALTEKSAYLVLPQQYVAGPMVQTADWSRDGRFMLICTVDMHLDAQTLRRAMAGGAGGGRPEGGARLLVWAAKDGSTQVVWRSPSPDISVETHWLPGSTVALVLLHNVLQSPAAPPPGTPPDYRDVLLRVDGPTGSARILVRSEQMESFTIAASPTQPLAVLRRMSMGIRQIAKPDGSPGVASEMRDSLHVIRADSSVGPAIAPPPDVRIVDTIWVGQDKLALRCLEGKRQPQAKRTERFYLMDTRSGTLQPVDKLPAPQEVIADERPVKVTHGSAKLVDGQVSKAVRPVWIAGTAQGKEPPALVAAHASWSSLSPAGDAVAYQAGGSLYVCPLMEVSRAEFEAARDAARRTVALSNGKQCALAVLMYSQDHDEKLPGQGDDIGGILEPYLKSTGPLEGFVYTFGGGTLAGVQSPAETEMGYVTGPGGRAIVYIDGHVKWKPDK